MSIALIVTRGFGNGTLVGSVSDVVLAGYAIGTEVITSSITTGLVSRIVPNDLTLSSTINSDDTGMSSTIEQDFGMSSSIVNVDTGISSTISDDGVGLSSTIQ